MSAHDEIRNLLPLAAAGELAPEENVQVERHVRECQECAMEMMNWQALSSGLHHLPTPQPSARLIQLTHARVTRQMAESAERRWDQGVLISLVIFGWLLAMASWLVVRFLSGSYLVWLSPEFSKPWLGFSIYTGLIWLTGGIAAVMLGLRRRREGRTI